MFSSDCLSEGRRCRDSLFSPHFVSGYVHALTWCVSGSIIACETSSAHRGEDCSAVHEHVLCRKTGVLILKAVSRRDREVGSLFVVIYICSILHLQAGWDHWHSFFFSCMHLFVCCEKVNLCNIHMLMLSPSSISKIFTIQFRFVGMQWEIFQ